MKSFMLFWMLLFTVAGCGPTPSVGQTSVPASTPAATVRPQPTVKYEPKDLDVFEAVIRYEIEQSPRSILYLCLTKGQNPSPEFMQRFAEFKAQVKPGSQWRRPTKEFKGDGATFTIRSVQWSDANTATVEGHVYIAPLAGMTYRYTVIQRDGQWKVTQRVTTSIS